MPSFCENKKCYLNSSYITKEQRNSILDGKPFERVLTCGEENVTIVSSAAIAYKKKWKRSRIFLICNVCSIGNIEEIEIE